MIGGRTFVNCEAGPLCELRETGPLCELRHAMTAKQV